MMDVENKELSVIAIVAVITAIVIFFGTLIIASVIRDQKEMETEKQQMEICVTAGGTWIEGNCLNDGWRP